MPSSEVEPFDPLAGRVPISAESGRQLREAENVLASYHQASDLLAEAVQNAVDALDEHTARNENALRRLAITFDRFNKRFVVADTGIGLSRRWLDLVFKPNVSFKSGVGKQVTTTRSRGEKGVGLSFLLFACDRISIRTCDGATRHDVVVNGANTWVRSEGSSAKPQGTIQSFPPDEFLGSNRYTELSISGVDPDRFAEELFGQSADELEWTLRTKTAVGNTAGLFKNLGHPQPPDVAVLLHYRSGGSAEYSTRNVPFRYATPGEMLQIGRASGFSTAKVLDFEDLNGLDAAEQRRRLRGNAVHYAVEYESRAGRQVYAYFFAMEANAMTSLLTELRDDGRLDWVPSSWQGFNIATRDMPTGIQLRSGILPTRGWEQRVFALLQYDDLKLDLGRKSLPGRTTAMFAEIIREAWKDLRFVVERIPKTPTTSESNSNPKLERRLRAILKLRDLNSSVIPFAKIPDRSAAVAAVFHELLGVAVPRFVGLRPLTSGVLQEEDTLIVSGALNGQRPLHMIFAMTPSDILRQFDEEAGLAASADVAVVWTMDHHLDDAGIVFEPVSPDDFGASFLMQFHGLAGREEPLRLIILDDLVQDQ